MGGLRGRKWFCWEGGIRVSWIAAWKGHVPGGRVCKQPVIQLDVLPTALAAAGAEVKPEWQLDGVNLLPLLEGKTDTLVPRELYFRFGVQYAVRQGDWKLVKASQEMEPMLINLASDHGQPNIRTPNLDRMAACRDPLQQPVRRLLGLRAHALLVLDRQAQRPHVRPRQRRRDPVAGR
jgi:arylsulfatase A-like enzyme